MKLSIIVPVYNSEVFIENCIESILKGLPQDLVEIIIINDGSSDRSLEKIERFKSKQIIIINKKNSGCSSTRNIGLTIAKGEYITFIDSDDYIDKKYFETLFKYLDKGLDLIVFGMRQLKNEVEISRRIPTKNIFKEYIIMGSPVNKVFKSSIIKKNKIYFPEGTHYGEDLAFSFKYSCFSNKVLLIEEVLYNYIIHQDNSVNNFKKRMGIFESFKDIKLFLLQNNIEKKYQSEFFNFFVFHGVLSYFMFVNEKVRKKDREIFIKEYQNKKDEIIRVFNIGQQISIKIFRCLIEIFYKLNLYKIYRTLKK